MSSGGTRAVRLNPITVSLPHPDGSHLSAGSIVATTDELWHEVSEEVFRTLPFGGVLVEVWKARNGMI